MFHVVGSGPAGIACAHALLQQGLAVRMLDAAIQLEPARQGAVARLAASPPAGWDPPLLALIKEGTASTSKGIPLKLAFGSDFPYRGAERHTACGYEGVGLKPSLAQGGFSNVWGAAMMPYLDRDLADWPIATADLAEHYAAVLGFTGLAARTDDLAEWFPLHTPKPGALHPSRQSRALLDRLDRRRSALKAQGIHHGAARVAIRTEAPGQAGCVYCGLCMYGCPYGHIYNSAATLKELQQHPKFSYEPDTVVNRLVETAGGVIIHASELASGRPVTFEASRVFLAAGVIPTTKILLESKQLFDQTVWLRDSQYFLIPLLRPRRTPGVRREELHTLSQLFLEIFDAGISPNTIHLQVYSYNDLMSGAIREAFGKFGVKSDFLVRQLEDRLMVVQGYLHSDLSSQIAATLRRTSDGSSRLELKAGINPRTLPAVKRVISKLIRNARNLGGMPVTPMLQIGEPGRGYHSGGSFPMRRNPGLWESDTLGRPHGWSRVHAVDATVLPTIPATTITFSVMANAHRIGTESARLAESSAVLSGGNAAPPRTVLITGARGYLGSCVKAKFLREGWKVVELVRNPTAEELRDGRAIRFRLGEDLPPAQLKGDALVHCAYDFTGRSWEQIHEVNVLGSAKLLQASRAGGVRQVVFISTMSAFNGCRSLYGRAKLEIESRVPSGTLILRPGLIYGDAPRGMFGNLVAQVQKSSRAAIFGDGSQVLYLAHQADLCQAILDHAGRGVPAPGEALISAHDQGWTFKQILQEIATAKGKRLGFVRLPWRLVWLGIKTFETLGVPLKFRSDSLISLMNQDLHPSFAATHQAGLKFRPFQAGTLKL